ncbi:MAG: PIG-L family deacetylase [Archangium sp.]
MKLPERILFVGAHCDDVELFAGGSLARACFAKSQVGVLVFSDHRGIVDAQMSAKARAEMQDNMTWLAGESAAHLTDHTALLLPACRGDFEREASTIYAVLEGLRDRYDLVVTHADSDTNPDHQLVAAQVARVFKAHASVWGGEFANNDLGEFGASVFVALSDRELAAKERMVANYRSQAFGGRPYFDSDLVRAQARVRGAQIRVPWAEAFSIGARVVVR